MVKEETAEAGELASVLVAESVVKLGTLLLLRDPTLKLYVVLGERARTVNVDKETLVVAEE
jgi:hypothetical protein